MDDNLKRIVSEVVRISREHGKQVDINVVAYMACLTEAQGVWEQHEVTVTLQDKLDAKAVASVAQILLPIVTSVNNPTLQTARMQILMEATFKEQRGIVEREQAEQFERVGMLERAVTGPRRLQGNLNEAYEKFYRIVMEYVCVAASLDMALVDETAGAEVRAALESVFPVSTVARFLTLTEAEKQQQVQELTRIVTGICLYNRTISRGGHALPAAAATYLPQANRLLRDMNRYVTDLGEELTRYAGMLGVLHKDKDSDEAAARQYERLHDEMVNKAQSLHLFDSLQRDLQEGLDATQQLNAELDHLMLVAVDTIGNSAAVSKEAIYPIFDRTGAIHAALHQELRMLVVRQRLYDELVSLQGGYVQSLPPAGVSSRAGSAGARQSASQAQAEVEVEGLADQLSQAALESLVSSLPEGMAYVGPSSLAQMAPDAALSGFCPVTLANKSGMLRRGRPGLGYLQYNDRLYTFADKDSMQMFAKDPTSVMSGIAISVSHTPLLHKLLGMYSAETHASPSLDVHSVLDIMSGPLKVDFSCQTPVHFVEKHIDPNYEWNVWALRRRALALANLRQKATHSTQTGASHFRRDADTQVWKPKEAQVQTRVNKGQTMPKKLQYVAGLRGAPDVKMNVIRMELELGQPHQH